MGEMANQGSDTLMAVTNFINSTGRHLDELIRDMGRILQSKPVALAAGRKPH